MRQGTLRLAKCWDGSEGGKYEVCVLTERGNDKSRDDEWVLLLLTFHKNVPLSRHFTALACRQQQPPCTMAQNPTITQNVFNPQLWLNTLHLLTVSDKLDFGV